MTFLQATAYGLVQGIAEFLPISSSAHLVLLPWAFGWKDPGQTFDVALHFGTLAAISLYFLADWKALLTGALKEPRGPGGRRLLFLATATVPGVIAGLFLEKQAETVFRDPARIALALAVFGLLLAAADRLGRRERGLETTGLREAIIIGAAQALAIVPGVSRSGATITAGLSLGLTREAAARYSFLLALPITFGACILKLRHLTSADLTPVFLWAVLVSGLSGMAVIHFFLRQLRRSSLWPYAAYRLFLSAFIWKAL